MVLLWEWRDLHTPPRAGGLLDQEAGFLRRARYLEAVYNVMHLWYTNNAGQIDRQGKQLFDYVLELRKQHVHTG